jgi:phosphate-selective porin OprO and OprP
MRNLTVLLFGALLSALLSPLPTRAEDTNTLEVIKQLQKRIEELENKVKTLEASRTAAPGTNDTQTREQVEALDQKVKVLEREKELEQEATEAKAKAAPKISIGSNGFNLSSAKGDFAVQLKGVLQVDSRSYFDNPGVVSNEGFLLRRARPILQGTVFQDFDFLFVPDFAPSTPTIFDAYLNYRYSPALQFQTGKFKVPIGLEQLQADRDILFNERALATDLVPNRDVGFMMHGDLFGGFVSYAGGILNGTSDGANSSNVNFSESLAYEGRLFLQPFKRSSAAALQGLGFGVSGGYETMSTTNTAGLPSTTGGTLPGYFTDGQQQFFAYNPGGGAVVFASDQHWRLSPQAYYYYGPFGLMGEYVISDQFVRRAGVAPFASADLQNTGWEVSASWVLTGEDAAFAGGVVPRLPFNPAKGHWGALQLVGRYAELNVDPAAFPLFSDPVTSARSAAAWSVGLNWYMNRNVMIKLDYSHTTFTGGGGPGTSAPATVTRQPESVLFTRIQLAF